MKTKLEDLMTNLKLNKFLEREEEKEECKKTWLIVLAMIGAAALIGTCVFLTLRKIKLAKLEALEMDDFDEEDFFDDLEDEADEIAEEAEKDDEE